MSNTTELLVWRNGLTQILEKGKIVNETVDGNYKRAGFVFDEIPQSRFSCTDAAKRAFVKCYAENVCVDPKLGAFMMTKSSAEIGGMYVARVDDERLPEHMPLMVHDEYFSGAVPFSLKNRTVVMMNKHFLFLQPGRRWHVIENAIKETYLPTFKSFLYGDRGRWNKELQDEFVFPEMTRGNVSFNSWEMHAVEGWSTVGMYVSDEEPVLHPWMLTNHYYWYRPGKRDVVSSYHDGNEVVRCYPLAVIGGNEERGMEHERLERFHRFQWQMYNFYGIYHGRETSEISYCVLVQGRGRSEIVNLKEVVEGIEGVLRLRVVYMERMKSMGERIETFAYSRCLISADESVFENLYFMGGRSLILEITGGSRGEEVSGGDRSGGDRSEGDGDGEIGRSESESDRRGRTSSDRRSRTSSKSYAERISNELFYRYYNFKAKVVRDESDQMNNRGMYVNMTRFMHDFIRII